MVSFGQIINLLTIVRERAGSPTWKVDSNGILTIQVYVGMENYDLYRQGLEMFADSDA